mmetsp:Transcript_40464/g.77316  ORF Transcript_40464/g.77316 Transcript_40464/m.77316 type:complete len:240 (-) Transcript_40464:630-1349(-)
MSPTYTETSRPAPPKPHFEVGALVLGDDAGPTGASTSDSGVRDALCPNGDEIPCISLKGGESCSREKRFPGTVRINRSLSQHEYASPQLLRSPGWRMPRWATEHRPMVSNQTPAQVSFCTTSTETARNFTSATSNSRLESRKFEMLRTNLPVYAERSATPAPSIIRVDNIRNVIPAESMKREQSTGSLPCLSVDSRHEKFARVLSMPTVDLDHLRELAWNGIPGPLRPVCWRLLLVCVA